MKRLMLCGLLLVHGWAWACEVGRPTAAQLAARKELQRIPGRTMTCPTQASETVTLICKLYSASPTQLLPLFKKAYSAQATARGQGWHLSWRDAEGSKGEVTLQPASGGTRMEYRRSIPVAEQLHMDLSTALLALGRVQKNSPLAYIVPPDCISLGVRSGPRYSVASCAVFPGNLLGGEPSIAISIARAADTSVPLNKVRYFTYEKGCGPHFIKEKP